MPGRLGIRERCTLWLGVAVQRVGADSASAVDLLDRIAGVPACPSGDLPALRARLFLLEARAALAQISQIAPVPVPGQR